MNTAQPSAATNGRDFTTKGAKSTKGRKEEEEFLPRINTDGGIERDTDEDCAAFGRNPWKRFHHEGREDHEGKKRELKGRKEEEEFLPRMNTDKHG